MRILSIAIVIFALATLAHAAPYLGDFAAGATVHFKWSSNGAKGASITRSTDGTVSVYRDNETTQTTTGVTDTEDFDSLTGVHQCAIDTSTSSTYYAAGHNYMVVLSAATIDSQTVNAVLAHFSVSNRLVNVTQWNGTNVAAPATAGYPAVTIKDGTGTGEVDTDAGTVLLRSATETQIDNIETDTAAWDTANEARTLLTGGTSALSILTASDNIGINWADVANPTSTVGLTNTSIALTTATIWTHSSRTLTALDEDNTTIDLNGTTIGTVTTVTGADWDQWDNATRTLTALDEDATTIDLNGSTIGTVTTVTGADWDQWDNGTRTLTALDEDSTTIDLDNTTVSASVVLGANSITSATIAANAIGASELGTDAITNDEIAASAAAEIIAGVGGASGPGATSTELTIDDGTDPLADVSVWLSTDADGSTVVAGTLISADDGTVTFLLDSGGTYYIWCKKVGYADIKGTSFVQGVTSTFSMSAAAGGGGFGGWQ